MYGIRGKKMKSKKNQIQKFNLRVDHKPFDPRNPVTLDGYRKNEFVTDKKGPKGTKNPMFTRPDFFDVEKPSRRGDGEFKQRHERNLNEKLSTLDWRKSKKTAAYQMPLKKEHTRAQKRRIVPFHTSHLNRTSGKRHYNRHLGQPKSKSPTVRQKKMRPETVNYANSQYKKQKDYEIQLQKEANYKKKTPKRKNKKELNNILSYSYVRFPDDKLTQKPNQRNGTFDPKTYINTSPINKKNYYGRRFTDITRSSIILG